MKLTLFALLLLLSIHSFSQKDDEYHLNKEYEIAPKAIIKLKISDAKVSILGSKRTTAHVKIDRIVTTKGIVFGHHEFSIDVKQENGNLDLSEHSNSVSGVIGFSSEKYTVNLELPEDASLIVKGDDGDYLIQNIAGSILMRLDDAHVELTGCQGEKFEFYMNDGDIKMDQGKGKLEITGDDTDVHIRNAAFTGLRADINDGDMTIETSIDDQGNYSIRANDGLVSFTVLNGGGTFDIHHEDGHVTTEGSFNVVEKTDQEMRLTLAHGKANVNIRSDDARVRLIATPFP
jgi:hypothetical protein